MPDDSAVLADMAAAADGPAALAPAADPAALVVSADPATLAAADAPRPPPANGAGPQPEAAVAPEPDAVAAALLAKAVAAHRLGVLGDAERLYRQVTARDAANFDALHMLGVIHAQRQDLPEAIALLQRAVQVRPDEAAAHVNLANALRAAGRWQEAVASYDRALSIQPANLDALCSRGHALRHLKQWDAALGSYDAALRIEPGHIDALYHRADVLARLGRLAEAAAAYDATLALQPDFADALYNRGNVLFSLQRYDDAVASYDAALRLRPEEARSWNNRGNALRQPAEALASYDRALALDPGFAEAHSNRGNALQALGRSAEALASYDRALQLAPAFADAWCNRGTVLAALGRWDEALASYDRALQIAPAHVDTYNNRGQALLETGLLPAALDSLARALALNPEHVDAHVNTGLCRLLLGDLPNGWREFEWRWRGLALAATRPHLDATPWLGEQSLYGKTILLWCEQGLGDSIQFSRFARQVSARGATVLLWTHSALESLMATLDGPDQILRAGQPVPKTDYHCPLLSLPLALGIGLDSIPAEPQYLYPDPDRVAAWSERLGPRAQPRIGIAWSGNPAHKNDRNRSILLAQFATLAQGPFEFVCVQKELREHDRPVLESRADIRSFCDALTDFDDTAALLQHMDLVITVDTSVAHLAAALGRPVWLLLSHVPDWRWMLDRDDSPWYPTMRLIRQPRPGDWASVFEQVTQALAGMTFPQAGPELAARDPALRWRRVRNDPAIAALLGQAVAAHRQGELAAAETLYRQVLTTQPQHFDALHMLGVVLAQRGQYADAIGFLHQALQVRPGDATAHVNLGNALRGAGRPQDAVAAYDRALSLHPANVEALLNRGHALWDLGKLADAAPTYQAALDLRPDDADTLYRLGTALLSLGRQETAVPCFDHALRLQPNDSGVWNNRGNALRDLGRLPEALISFERALAVDPNDAVLHNNRGTTLLDLGRHQGALECFDAALRLDPNFIEAHYNRGNAMRALDRLAEALADYDRALALQPDHADAWNNRGTVLHDLKRPAEALACYDRVLALRPDDAATRANAGLCRLLIGDFRRGWQGFEYRGSARAPHRPDFHRPMWLGKESLAGRSILLWAEQGFGDTIQFCRFVRLVKARGATVVLSVPRELEPLLAGLPGVDRLVRNGEALPDTDFVCALPSLPLAFDVDLASIPAEPKYLEADPVRVAAWAAVLGPRRRPRIGLVWSGNPEHRNDRHRSIPLPQFMRLADTAFDFVCLQKDVREADRVALAQRPDLRLVADRLGDFADTAALLQHMDLVITVDTSVAHLAGALGRPVWLLLGFVPDWRWLLDRDDSPWYPTARLFRQPQPGDWDSVLARVAQELAAHAFPPVPDVAAGPAAGDAVAGTATASDAAADMAAANDPAAAMAAANDADAAAGQGANRAAAAVAADNQAVHALLVQANQLAAEGRTAEALAAYDEALHLRPNDPNVLNNRGNALRKLGRLDAALACYDRALTVAPGYAAAHGNRGVVLQALRRLPEALASYDRALAIAPDHAITHSNRASVLVDLKRPQDALRAHDRALAIVPDYAEAHVDAAMCRLLLGDYAAGWQEYEWRWRVPVLQAARPDLPAPLWLGQEELDGKSILLWCEQGLGDSIQFCRFATAVAARGAKVLLWPQAALQTLMTGLAGVDRVLRPGEHVPRTDFHCPLLSLPLALGIGLANLPAPRQYLYADPQRVAAWGERLGLRRRPRIGLAWSGNPEHRGDRNRSIPLAQFSLPPDDRFEFVCLQREIRDGDKAALAQRPDIRWFGEALTDLDETAALIQHMDAVVTVDTAVAHLAGALGRPLWVLLAFAAEWRWLLDRTDSPWYPTARLFRQQEIGDWTGVFAAVRTELAVTRFAASAQETRGATETDPTGEAHGATADADRATQQRRAAALAATVARAAAAHGAGRLAEAEQLYRDVLAQAPQHFDAMHMLGVVYAQRQDYPQAIDWLGRALQQQPENAVAHCNLGNALRGSGRLRDAIASYDRALRIDPAYPDALCNRGHAWRGLGQLAAASTDYAAALQIDPHRIEALFHHATVLFRLERLHDALNVYGRLLQIAPGHIDALVNRGNVLLGLHWPEDALLCFDRALRLAPDHPAALTGRGNALRRLRRLDEALATFDRALAIAPNDAAVHANRGYALEDAGRPDDALRCYERALAIAPDTVQVHVNAALCRLLTGDFANGWREYEWRWQLPALQATAPQHRQPRWDGRESLRGKSILLWDEQGIGDAVQFCRFAKLVAAEGATVVLGVPELLAPLLSNVAGVSRIVTSYDPSLPVDYHCPLLSLPLAFDIGLDRIPAERQYLFADPALVAKWQAMLGEPRRPRIGLAWSGDPAHRNDRNRSIPLDRCVRIARAPFDFVCLQKEVRAADRPVLRQHPELRAFCDEIANLPDTAALIEGLDLVITVDTAVAHLAGALGRPVWIMLPYNPDWRWLRTRDDSPWYPTARLFRQPEPGDWQSVIDRVVAELAAWPGQAAP